MRISDWSSDVCSSDLMNSHILRSRRPPFHAGRLDRKMCEFIYIAVDAAVSHLFLPGMEMHFKVALRMGATAAELMEVIQLAMLAAYSPHTAGLPILAEELERAGLQTAAARRALTPEQEAVKARLDRQRTRLNSSN